MRIPTDQSETIKSVSVDKLQKPSLNLTVAGGWRRSRGGHNGGRSTAGPSGHYEANEPIGADESGRSRDWEQYKTDSIENGYKCFLATKMTFPGLVLSGPAHPN